MKDAELTAVLERRNERELLATRARLIDDKKRIERQISDDKFDMMADRAELINSGVDMREAQLRATAGGDTDWRARAVHAGIVIDGQLARVKSALADLRVAKQEANAAAPTGDARKRHEQWELYVMLLRERYEESTDLITDRECRDLLGQAVHFQRIFDRERGE